MSQIVNVATLARAKILPNGALLACSVEDVRGQGVVIPYCDETGPCVARKRRTALAAKDGSLWPAKTPAIAYGLWKLPDAQKAGQLILVEGESDCWVLWHHRYPALGIPGSSNAKTLTAEALVGIQHIDVVIEPDLGGETFRQGVGRRLMDLNFNGQAAAPASRSAASPRRPGPPFWSSAISIKIPKGPLSIAAAAPSASSAPPGRA